jgi:hypothetical protein
MNLHLFIGEKEISLKQTPTKVTHRIIGTDENGKVYTQHTGITVIGCMSIYFDWLWNEFNETWYPPGKEYEWYSDRHDILEHVTKINELLYDDYEILKITCC